jgi:hypothetical protein
VLTFGTTGEVMTKRLFENMWGEPRRGPSLVGRPVQWSAGSQAVRPGPMALKEGVDPAADVGRPIPSGLFSPLKLGEPTKRERLPWRWVLPALAPRFGTARTRAVTPISWP